MSAPNVYSTQAQLSKTSGNSKADNSTFSLSLSLSPSPPFKFCSPSSQLQYNIDNGPSSSESSQRFYNPTPTKSTRSGIQRGRLLCDWKFALLLAALILTCCVLALVIVLSLTHSKSLPEIQDQCECRKPWHGQ